MSTIQIQVSDEVIAHYGMEAVQEKIQKQMDWEELRLKALKVKATLEAHGLDHDELTKEAKKEPGQNTVALY
ncbi:hypothetical protein [Spirosoma koreense]